MPVTQNIYFYINGTPSAHSEAYNAESLDGTIPRAEALAGEQAQ
jgi:hypothetical protein